MPYTPPPMMNFAPVNFGSMAPGGGMGAMGGGMPQGGLLNAVTSALQGNPQGGLAKQLFGGMGGQQGDPSGAAPSQPPQLGMLTKLFQGLGGGGMGGGAGISPTALTGLW